MQNQLGITRRLSGLRAFTLFAKTGVEIVYLYFQIPLMILVIAPAIDGLQARVARGGVESRRELVAVLAPRRRCRC